MSQLKRESFDENDGDDIRSLSIVGSEYTLETLSIGTKNENCSVATSDFVQLDQPDEVPGQQEEQQQEDAEQQANYQEIIEKMLFIQKKHRTQMEQIEIEKELALKSVEEKYQKKVAILKEQLKDKANGNEVYLFMGKKLIIPIGNLWNSKKGTDGIHISTDGLNAKNNATGWRSVSAEKGFSISADFPGRILHYFEITNMSPKIKEIYVGLSSGNILNGIVVGGLPNSYSTREGTDSYYLPKNIRPFEWPEHAIKPKWNGKRKGNVIGCGLLLNPDKELAIFFTGNGVLLGKQIPITPTVTTLYPTVSMLSNASVEANFGDDLAAKPFKYDIENCTGMVFK